MSVARRTRAIDSEDISPGGLRINTAEDDRRFYRQLLYNERTSPSAPPAAADVRRTQRFSGAEERNSQRYNPVHHRYEDTTTQQQYLEKQAQRRQVQTEWYSKKHPVSIDGMRGLNEGPAPAVASRRKLTKLPSLNDSPIAYVEESGPLDSTHPFRGIRQTLASESQQWWLENKPVSPTAQTQRAVKRTLAESSQARDALQPHPERPMEASYIQPPAIPEQPRPLPRYYKDTTRFVAHDEFVPSRRTVLVPPSDIISFEPERQRQEAAVPSPSKRIFVAPYQKTFNIINGAGDHRGQAETIGYTVSSGPSLFRDSPYRDAPTTNTQTRIQRENARSHQLSTHYQLG